MSDRLLWLPDVLRSAGLDVYEMPGWDTRGADRLDVQGVVWHHTATGIRWADGHVAALLRDGRRDLAGPLSQLGLERDGTFVIVASGRANHNGYGRWGNDSIGIEAYNDGIGEPWPQVQLDAYHVGTASILRHLRMGADRVLGHREADPRRKIDPTGIDMGAARLRLTHLLAQEDDMVVHIIGADRDGRFWSFKNTDQVGVEWSKETADFWWNHGGEEMQAKYTDNPDLIEILKDSNDLAPLAGRAQ